MNTKNSTRELKGEKGFIMYITFLYQRHLTEDQWFYINKAFLRMIADTVNIPYAPYSRQSCICWTAATNGECFPRIFRNGSRYISFP